MKHCEEYTALLSAFADGELADAEREKVLAHLDNCEGCRQYLSELSALHTVLGELGETSPPAFFAETVMAKVRAEKINGRRKSKSKAVRYLAPIAACAAIALIVGGILPEKSSKADFGMGASVEAPRMMMAAAVTESAEETVPAEENAPAETETGSYSYSALQLEGYHLDEKTEDAVNMEAAIMGAEPAADSKTHVLGEAYPAVYALSDEAEQFLMEQGAEILQQTEGKTSYLADIALVKTMQKNGLLTERGNEELAIDELSEGGVEVIVRITEESGVSP